MKGAALLISFLIIVSLAAWMGIEMRHDPGYVMIAYKGWSIESSFWVIIAAAIITFIAVYMLIWLIGVIIHLPSRLRKWRSAQQKRKAVRKTNRGLCELAEGRWAQAEKNLVQGAKKNSSSFMNYLAAARAAQAQLAFERRDNYLRKAHAKVSGSKLAIGLTQAQLEIGSKQWQKAKVTLTALQKEAPKHPFILELLSRLHLEQQDWGSLKNILPQIKRYRALEPIVIEGLEEKIYLAEITQAATSKDSATLSLAWKSLPRQWRQDNLVKKQYIQCLLEQNRSQEAIPEIENILKKVWNPELAEAYGKLDGDNPNKQLSTAEGWIKKYPDQPQAYLTCGRLCKKLKLWGQAKEYLEQSIALQPRASNYHLLGTVFEEENNEERAMECYRKALEISDKADPNKHSN